MQCEHNHLCGSVHSRAQEEFGSVKTSGDERLYPALSGRAWSIFDSGLRLEALSPEFSAGDFLLGAAGVGSEAPRGVAAALRAAGVAAVIGQTIDPAFFAEALDAGLPAVAIEEAAAIKSGDRLRVDIESFRVANRNSGDRYIIKNLDDKALEQLRTAANRE